MMTQNKLNIFLLMILLILTVTACTEIVQEERPVPQTKMMEWSTYENTRFNYEIKYPKHWNYKESQNNDGIQLMTEENQDIRVYGSHFMEGTSSPLKNAEEYNVDPETIVLDSGIEAKLINGSINDEHIYEMVVVTEEMTYHFVAETSSDFFNNNRNLLERMAYSFNITEGLTTKRALSIEKLFHKLVFKPILEEGSYRVLNFDTKEALINEASKYAAQSLVADYVDDYYTMENDALEVIPTEGPATIIEEVDYDFNKRDDGTYALVQTNNSELYGRYQLTVEFKKIDGVWKINDRTFEVLQGDE